MVQGHAPVFAEELGDVGDESAFEPDAELIEVLLGEADEGDDAGDVDIFVGEVGDAFDDAVVVEAEADVLALAVDDVVGDEVFAVVDGVELYIRKGLK